MTDTTEAVIIVTGSITARAEHFDALLSEALAHVRRSRLEEGCIRHSVHVDAENPLRLFFYEEWRDMAALQAHFAHPDSQLLMAAIKAQAESADPLSIMAANRLR